MDEPDEKELEENVGMITVSCFLSRVPAVSIGVGGGWELCLVEENLGVIIVSCSLPVYVRMCLGVCTCVCLWLKVCEMCVFMCVCMW